MIDVVAGGCRAPANRGTWHHVPGCGGEPLSSRTPSPSQPTSTPPPPSTLPSSIQQAQSPSAAGPLRIITDLRAKDLPLVSPRKRVSTAARRDTDSAVSPCTFQPLTPCPDNSPP